MLYNIKNILHIICTFGFIKLFIYVSKIITNKISNPSLVIIFVLENLIWI